MPGTYAQILFLVALLSPGAPGSAPVDYARHSAFVLEIVFVPFPKRRRMTPRYRYAQVRQRRTRPCLAHKPA